MHYKVFSVYETCLQSVLIYRNNFCYVCGELTLKAQRRNFTPLLILQPFLHFTYITTHSPTLPSLYLRHSSFSNPSVAPRHSSFSNPSVPTPTPQLILQPFRRFTYATAHSPILPLFTYVTAHSPTLLSLLLRHRLFTYVTWRAAYGLNFNKNL